MWRHLWVAPNHLQLLAKLQSCCALKPDQELINLFNLIWKSVMTREHELYQKFTSYLPNYIKFIYILRYMEQCEQIQIQWGSEIRTSWFQITKKRLVWKWSEFWMESGIGKPKHLKTDQNGCHLVCITWNLDILSQDFERFSFQLVGTKTMFENQTI